MADREDVARRHGIPHLADQLVGDTHEALEADAAARAALISMFGFVSPRAAVEEPAPAPSEPAPEESPLPPGDKPFDEYTESEWQAVHAESERRMRQPAPPREEVAPEGLHLLLKAIGYTQYDVSKAQREAEIVRMAHPEDEDE